MLAIHLYPQRALRVYLAGPDVFDRDSGNIFTRLSRLAHAQDLAPIVPMEGWGNVNSGPGSSIAPGSGSAAKDPSEAQRILRSVTHVSRRRLLQIALSDQVWKPVARLP